MISSAFLDRKILDRKILLFIFLSQIFLSKSPVAAAEMPRVFYDFGSGMLGDWGCHTLDKTNEFVDGLIFKPKR